MAAWVDASKAKQAKREVKIQPASTLDSRCSDAHIVVGSRQCARDVLQVFLKLERAVGRDSGELWLSAAPSGRLWIRLLLRLLRLLRRRKHVGACKGCKGKCTTCQHSGSMADPP